MYSADLSLDKAPPLGAPLLFFLTAPPLGVLAGALLLWAGPDALASRWTPELLALTHLLTLGVLATVMFGAILQMIAVVAGTPVARPMLVGGAAHAALTVGGLSLSAALLWGLPWLFHLAAATLLLGVGGFAAVVWLTLAQAPWSQVTAVGIRLALAGLALTLALGLALALGHALAGFALPRFPLTDLHVAWGIGGWIGLLVIGVAYQVVPMFQITPSYPGWMTRRLVPALLVILLAWSAGVVLAHRVHPAWGWAAELSALAGLLGFGAFGVLTLGLQARRRRRLPDVTTDFWRLAMAALLAAGSAWLAARLWPGFAGSPAYPLLLGALLLAGFALSAINGMLYKIVPFLVWLHLQNRQLAAAPGAPGAVPHMKQIIRDRRARWQLRAHCLALALLLAAAVAPRWFTQPAALAFIGSFALLGVNLGGAALLYRRQARSLAG